MPPTIPINHYLISTNQQGRDEVLSYHSMLAYSRQKPAWNTLISSKWKSWVPHHTLKCSNVPQEDARTEPDTTPRGRTGRSKQKSNYELFNRNNFNIRYWSWNYRGCWHQTCPPIVYRRGVYIVLIPITRPYKDIVLLFIVTTSKSFHWVICAPAAFRRSGGHFSGPLSSIEPWSPVPVTTLVSLYLTNESW